METERLSGALEENVLAVLCWSEKYFLTIRNKVKPEDFALRAFQDIARVAVEFIDRYQRPPRRYLEELLDREIKSQPSGLIAVTVESLPSSAEELNEQFVLDSLDKFQRLSRMKSAVEEVSIALADDDVLTAEGILANANQRAADVPSGTFLRDTAKVLSYLEPTTVEDEFSCGVPVLDRIGVGIRRRTMTILIGLPNVGKTWWAIEIGKQNWILRKKVLHITLEMSEEDVVRRYVQAFFGVTAQQSGIAKELRVPLLETDELGRVTKIAFNQLKPGMLSGITAKKLSLFTRRAPLMVLEFPTSTLTTAQLKAQLTLLERTIKFTPDLVIVDMPDLMQLDPRNLRQDTGRLYKDLRGIAMDRHLAMIGTTHANRSATQAKLITRYHLSEDFSKAGTADNVLTITKTPGERKLNLARVYIDKARYSEVGWIAAIAQAYAIGQFCTSSALGGQVYEAEVKRQAPEEEDAESEKSAKSD